MSTSDIQHPSAEPGERYDFNSSYLPGRTDVQVLRPDYEPPARPLHSSGSECGAPSMAQSDHTPRRSGPERQRDLEEEQSGAELSHAARSQGNSDSGTPFYTGERLRN